MGDGIIFIDASNITFDCNNAEILPATWGSGIILSYKNNNVIKNCNLKNHLRAISLDHSHNNRIENSSFSSNIPGTSGVYLYYSDYNVIENNDFDSNYRGINIERYSDHNEIKNNTMTSNNSGVFSSSNNADHNVILYNSISGSTNYGVYIASDHNDISENDFNNSGSDLYLHTMGEYNRVTGNNFSGAGVTAEGSFTDFCSGNRNYYALGAARPDVEDRCGYFSISLNKGWNLISIPINLTNKTLPAPLKSIEGNYSKVVAYDANDIGNEWKIFDPNDLDHSNLNSIDEKMGLWINMLANDTLVVEGFELNSTINFSLKQGYNLIGYPSLEERNISVVFENVSDDLVNVLAYENDEWKSYDLLKVDELNSLKTMKPGYGYWVNVNKGTKWIFEEGKFKEFGKRTFSRGIITGWNLVSIPLVLDNETLPTALSSIEGKYSKVVTYDAHDIGNEWKLFDPNDLAHSNLNSIDKKMGLWIKMLNNDSLIINGTVPEATTFNLKQGWNLIGYPSLNESNVSIVFNNINASLVNVLSYENNTWFGYSPIKPINSLEIIKPGFGYLVNVDENVDLTI